MLTIEEKHELCLYPEVRISAEKVTGSGTIIYSAEKPDDEGRFETYVLTNEHVVDDLIEVKEKFDSLLQRDVKRDILGHPKLEVFKYDYTSRVIGGTTYQTDIAAYDKDEDLALLELETPDPFEFVASLYPREATEELTCWMQVINLGCGLGYKPVIAPMGYISGFGYEIENKDFMMVTSLSYFGNSGGASFLAETGEMIGVPSRISVSGLGWNLDVPTHLGFSIPIWRIYDFLEDQIFQFIYDDEYTSVQCAEMREKKREEERLRMAREDGEG